MKKLVFLLFMVVSAAFIAACDKIKDDVMPEGFQQLILHDDYYSTPANTAVVLTILQNDTITGPAKVTMGSPAHGAILPGSGAGEHIYQPSFNFSGKDTVTYTACIGLNCKTAKVSISVSAAPCTITARDDSASTPHQTPISIPVLNNDQTCGAVNITLHHNKRGMASLSGNQILFTPFPGFSGRTSIGYTICNDTGCDTAEVIIIVEQPLTPPCNLITRTDTLWVRPIGNSTTFEYINVLENDIYCSNIPIDNLTVIYAGNPQYGWAEIDQTTPPNFIKYSTNYYYPCTNMFTYRVCQTINGIQVCKNGNVMVFLTATGS